MVPHGFCFFSALKVKVVRSAVDLCLNIKASSTLW